MSGHAKFYICAIYTLVFFASETLADYSGRSLVSSSSADNAALLVGVSHGLPGIDIDVDNMEEIATHSAFGFEPRRLEDPLGTSKNVKAELTRVAQETGPDGTMLFYYSGHGDVGSLYLEDGEQDIQGLRKAIERGRANLGPLERLVMVIDACFSGSLLDPMRISLLGQIADPQVRSMLFVDSVFSEMSSRSNYWKTLMVIASSQANETSLAGSDGSEFTNAFVRAFQETELADGNMTMLVNKTKQYTVGHHPVARFAPSSLQSEPLIR